MSMKILLLGNYTPSQQQSMLRFGDLMCSLLRESGHDVRVVQAFPVLCKLRQAETGAGKWLGYVDQFLLFLPRLKREAAWADSKGRKFRRFCHPPSRRYLSALLGFGRSYDQGPRQTRRVGQVVFTNDGSFLVCAKRNGWFVFRSRPGASSWQSPPSHWSAPRSCQTPSIMRTGPCPRMNGAESYEG